MQTYEAGVFLSACRPLLNRVEREGYNIKLTSLELDVLEGFRKVLRAGLTDDINVRFIAKISIFEIGVLKLLAG